MALSIIPFQIINLFLSFHLTFILMLQNPFIFLTLILLFQFLIRIYFDYFIYSNLTNQFYYLNISPITKYYLFGFHQYDHLIHKLTPQYL